MATLNSMFHTLNPFGAKPDLLPVIAYGNGERVLRFVCSAQNAKGMITVETLPDLADGGKPRQFSVKQSLAIKRFYRF